MSPSTERPAALGIIGFMIAAVLFAGLAGVLLSQLLENKYSQEPVKAIVVTNRNVPAGEPLTEDALTIAEWPQPSVPAGAFGSVAAVLKNAGVPLIPLVKGEAVLASHLSKKGTGLGVAALIEGDKRAMALKVDDAVALAGLVYPGARVDILATVQGTGMATRTVLQNVKVLAVGEDMDPLTIARRRREKEARAQEEGGGAFDPGDEDSREKRGVLTVEVSPEEAERLTLAARDGRIDIALRNPKNAAVTETSGVTRLALMGAEEGGPMESWAPVLSSMGGVLSGGGARVAPLARNAAARKTDGATASARARRRKTNYTKAKIEESPGPSVQIYRGGNK